MLTLTGLSLDVYRAANGIDCTNGGITSAVDRLTLVGSLFDDETFVPSPRNSRVFAPTDEAPPVALRRILDSAHLVLVDDYGQPFAGLRTMDGGNFAATSDSRLRDYFVQLGVRPFYGAVPVHDRIER